MCYLKIYTGLYAIITGLLNLLFAFVCASVNKMDRQDINSWLGTYKNTYSYSLDAKACNLHASILDNKVCSPFEVFNIA